MSCAVTVNVYHRPIQAMASRIRAFANQAGRKNQQVLRVPKISMNVKYLFFVSKIDFLIFMKKTNFFSGEQHREWAQRILNKKQTDLANLPKQICSIKPLVECFNTLGSFRCGNCPKGYIGKFNTHLFVFQL